LDNAHADNDNKQRAQCSLPHTTGYIAMTKDERLLEAIKETHIGIAASNYGYDLLDQSDADNLHKELAARGLAVVEIGEPLVTIDGERNGTVMQSGKPLAAEAHRSSSDREMAIARVLAGHSWDEWRFDMESEGDYPHISREDWIEHEAARESLRERARAIIAAEDAVGRKEGG
jgi:hypothetical protein